MLDLTFQSLELMPSTGRCDFVPVTCGEGRKEYVFVNDEGEILLPPVNCRRCGLMQLVGLIHHGIIPESERSALELKIDEADLPGICQTSVF